VKAKPGQSPAGRRQIEQVVGSDFPNVDINSRSQFVDMQEGTVDQFVAGLVALLVLSEIIASRATTDSVATWRHRMCCSRDDPARRSIVLKGQR
jgi:hypothetical protein